MTLNNRAEIDRKLNCNYIQNERFVELYQYQNEFESEGIIDITPLISEITKSSLSRDAIKIFEKCAQRKDFISTHTNTPRNMCTVSEVNISKHSKAIKEFYYSNEIIGLISAIAKEKISALPWTGERYVLNGLINNSDTHGWHWDDYAYALVYIVNCPPKEGGGELECIPNTTWNKENPNIEAIITANKVRRYRFEPESMYLMKSDTTLHRVAKILSPYQRLSVAMSYNNEADLRKDIDHKTVIDLYHQD